MARIFIPGAGGAGIPGGEERPAPGALEVEVRGEDLHYLRDVLRLAAGDPLDVFDGTGGVFAAQVVEVGARAARLRLGERRVVAAPRAQVTIVQALCKGEKMEWVVQKSVELGASRIVPLAAERSVVRLDGERAASRVERWRKIAAEASRQCGRADVPEVTAVRSLHDLDAALDAGGTRIVLHEGAVERMRAFLGGELYAVAIGPEGGFTSSEIAAAGALGFRPASLGGRILRTETVALAALALIQHAAGELG
jgi:16S rRNA (uracil1498-N3)-methyltransferase